MPVLFYPSVVRIFLTRKVERRARADVGGRAVALGVVLRHVHIGSRFSALAQVE